jgi:isoleucyl-tRNA synthetase
MKKDFEPQHKLDQWILSELYQLIQTVTENMDVYNLTKATRPMMDFVDNLSNWYIRRSRRRFWKSENDGDKFEAYQVLYTVLVEFSKLLAPFMPYLADEMYRNLTGEDPGFMDLRWPAGTVLGCLAYNYDGRIFVSDEGRMVDHQGDPIFQVGTVNDQWHDVIDHPTTFG